MTYNDINELRIISEDVVKFIFSTDVNTISIGKHRITKDIYVNIEEYDTCDCFEKHYEVHKKYIDVQYIIEGEELIALSPIDELVEFIPYNCNKDIAYYKESSFR